MSERVRHTRRGAQRRQEAREFTSCADAHWPSLDEGRSIGRGAAERTGA